MKGYFLINLALSALVIFLAFRLYGVWAIPVEEVHPPQKKAHSGKGNAETPQVKKDVEVYQEIVQKDLFRPSRTESKSEAKSGLPPTPPPKFFGTMIMDNDKIAILEDPTTKKRKAYRVKEHIGDFVISDIEKNKVILLRGEEKVMVNLREIKIISPPSRPGLIQPRTAPRPIPPPSQKPPVSPAPSPPSQPAPLSPALVPPPQPIPQTPEVMEESPQVAPLPEIGQ